MKDLHRAAAKLRSNISLRTVRAGPYVMDTIFNSFLGLRDIKLLAEEKQRMGNRW